MLLHFCIPRCAVGHILLPGEVSTNPPSKGVCVWRFCWDFPGSALFVLPVCAGIAAAS